MPFVEEQLQETIIWNRYMLNFSVIITYKYHQLNLSKIIEYLFLSFILTLGRPRLLKKINKNLQKFNVGCWWILEVLAVLFLLFSMTRVTFIEKHNTEMLNSYQFFWLFLAYYILFMYFCNIGYLFFSCKLFTVSYTYLLQVNMELINCFFSYFCSYVLELIVENELEVPFYEIYLIMAI